MAARMKIRSMLVADAANVTPDGKQNLLGAGVRIIRTPDLPFARPLVVFMSADGPVEDRSPVPVKIVVRSPMGQHTVMETEATLRGDVPIDKRLPLTLNIRGALDGYIWQEYGIHDIVATIGGSRATYRMIVDPLDPSSTEQ